MPDKDDQDKKIFKGDLGDYQVLQTEDGSITLHSEAFNEACHSLSGAVEETIYNYVQGCQITEKIAQNDTKILEVGFGLGTGYKTTAEYLAQLKTENSLTFISTELDKDLVDFAKDHNDLSKDLPFPSFKDLEYFTDPLPHYKAIKDKHVLIVLIGNARKTVRKANAKGLINSLDAIYQDPFSPKRNPALWTCEWFKLLLELSNDQTLMSTYSSSNSIRKSMIRAGWYVQNRKGFGTKRTATLATVIGSTENDVLLQLQRSPVKALEDSDLD